jgi:hypothetical protein
MKMTFENHGRTVTIKIDENSNISDVLEGFIAGCLGLSWSYITVVEGLGEKFEELKDYTKI